jgi:hypothetical protein
LANTTAGAQARDLAGMLIRRLRLTQEKETAASNEGAVAEAWNRAKETAALERKQSMAHRRRQGSNSGDEPQSLQAADQQRGSMQR